VLFGFWQIALPGTPLWRASTYSICSFASGLATSIAMLAVARFVLGLGMGGEGTPRDPRQSWPTNFSQSNLNRAEFLGS
jgi:MFS family permease